MTKKRIEHLLKKTVISLFKTKLPEVKIEYPPKRKYGDYSTNLPLELAKEIKKKPLKIAQNISSQILKQKPNIFEKIDIKKPGFINFFLKESYLKKELKSTLEEGKDFGKVNVGKNKKTNVEFISANPTGPLHIGNGRGAFFGDVLANILSFAGFKVEREYYINDSKQSSQIKELGKTFLGEGTAYKTPYLERLIKRIKSIKQAKQLDESGAGRLLAKEILKDIKIFVRKKLKIKFDVWFSEEGLFRKSRIKKVLDFLDRKGLTYEEEGALWLKTSKIGGIKDEVLVRRTGEPTYFLSDIAYHKDKIKRGYKKIIDIWGADHQGHVKRMGAAMKILGYKKDFEALISQIVRLRSGRKLSKRKGEIIELDDLIKEVGLDVARYFYLSKSLSSQMEFDLALAKERSEKNPVFYIQYAYVRIESILKKSKVKSQKSKVNFDLLNHPSELNLIRELIKFPEIIEDTANDYQLQRLPEYGKNLASSFHRFYRDCRVLRSNSTKEDKLDEELSKTRLVLVLATRIVLKNLLSLMGISTPKKM